MKNILISCILSIFFLGLSAQQVQRITQINYYGSLGLDPRNITPFNEKLYFSATYEGSYQNSLCMSDGTEAGTIMVKRINEDHNTGWATSLGYFVVYNNKLIFWDASYKKLWSSDGTTAGTQPFAGVRVGAKPVEYNGKLYFSGADTIQANPNFQLWVSDGTTTGTKLLNTINPAGNSNPVNFFVFNNLLYFGAYDNANSSQLWTTDGTVAGTKMLKQIYPNGSSYPSNFISFNNKLFFSANDGVNGAQIWTSDGTASGTTRVTTINVSLGYGLSPYDFTPFNGKIYFQGADTNAFYQLWATDGTATGTTLIKADHSIVNGVRGFQPGDITVFKNKLYMSAFDSVNQLQLWVSDGTTAGTSRVTDTVFSPRYLTVLNNTLVMQNGAVCASDGTLAGTKTCPIEGEYGVDFYYFQGFVPFAGALYFNASYQSPFDYQLCKFIDSPSGIPESMVKTFTVYPNPCDDHLTLNLKLPVANIQITDLNGKIILSAPCKTTTVNLSGLAPGNYLVIAQLKNGEKYISKFIKK